VAVRLNVPLSKKKKRRTFYLDKSRKVEYCGAFEKRPKGKDRKEVVSLNRKEVFCKYRKGVFSIILYIENKIRGNVEK
jgi:hypothetical protein